MKDKKIEALAKEAEWEGDNNLAIILHVYLGSKKANLDKLFAEHCQDFARSGLKMIEKMKDSGDSWEGRDRN